MQQDKRYSYKQRKIFGVVATVFFVLSALFLVTGIIMDSFFSTANVPAVVIAATVIGSTFCVPVFLISFVGFVDQCFHIRRIEEHHDGDSNSYRKDSVAAFAVSLVFFVMSILGDVWYFLRWQVEYKEDSAQALIIPMCIISIMILVRGLLFFRERNTEKYIDYVDARDGRKVRTDILSACFRLVIWGVISTFVIVQADTMTKYIYKSKHGRYEKTEQDFLEKATIKVSSESLKDGVWDVSIVDADGSGENLSPQLSFDEVEGAEYYFIYMVDESANNWVHWQAKVEKTQLALGANKSEYRDDLSFLYRGPYPPTGSGEHVYTVYVYAMKGEPVVKIEGGIGFDEPFLAADLLYYDILNVSDASWNPHKYGNVLAYGYVSGTYDR